MASISPPTPHNLTFPIPKFSSRRPFYPSPSPSHSLSHCRCHHHNPSSSSDNSVRWRWDSALHDVVNTALKRFDSYFNSTKKEPRDVRAAAEEVEEDEWDWDRWRKHFDSIDAQERLVSILKSQLGRAVYTEDFEDAARLKVAIAAAATNDTVGRVMSHWNKAIDEERFHDAAYMRDSAGAGLVGWWAGISKNMNDPHGLIIRITAEHGRYVARSYSPR